MKTFKVPGAALLLSMLIPSAYSATVTLNFDANAFNQVCNACITNSGAGAALAPVGTPPQFATTLGLFSNIPFNEVTVTGASGINGGAATTFAFTSTGTGFAYSGGVLTNIGSITSGVLSGISGTLITDSSPAVLASVNSGLTLAPVYFANGSVSVASALLTALGFDPSNYSAWLASDGTTTVGTACNYPEGARNPQTTGPLAGSYSGACAVGFGNGSTLFGAESQYMEVVITSSTVPEPLPSALVGCGLLAIALMRKKAGLSR